MPAEDGDDHGQTLWVDSGGDPPRHGEVARRDERLDLEEQWARPFERADHGRTGLVVLRAAEELGRILDSLQARARHLEDAELVRRPEPVFHRAKDAVRAVAVALEVQDAVDEVLEDPRSRDVPVLRHVPDEERGNPQLLRNAE